MPQVHEHFISVSPKPAADHFNLAELTIKAPFHMLRWLAMIVAGKTLAQIADAEGVSKRGVQDVGNLAFFAPEVLDRIAMGEQPSNLSTDDLIKTRFSAIWSEQHAQFAALLLLKSPNSFRRNRKQRLRREIGFVRDLASVFAKKLDPYAPQTTRQLPRTLPTLDIG